MTLLLLAGTGEAQIIARHLARAGVEAIASLAGGARIAAEPGLPLRTGGFGGEEEFRRFLDARNIRAVLDATHPFASRISDRTARICRDLGLPYCLLLRPEWVPENGDRWVFLDREEQAAEHIPTGATIFLTTGRQTLARFANLVGRRLIVRQINAPEQPFPFAQGMFLSGTPPFSVADEIETFRRHRVDWLIVKNAGGEAPRSKLIAARRLGLPVALINRPAPPLGVERVERVEQALDWVARL